MRFKQMLVTVVTLLLIVSVLPTIPVTQAQGPYDEAPMLAEMVAAGELPPVEERVGANPRVIEPVDEIGTYGGTLNIAFTGNIAFNQARFTWWLAHPMAWSMDFSEAMPNVFASMEPNEDATVWTIQLREGMKWSDGDSFDADDVLFAYNDVLLNSALNSNPPPWSRIAGEPGVMEKIDDLTLQMTFAASYGMFPEALARFPAWHLTYYPYHYLAPYHVDHGDAEAIQEMVDADENLSDWAGLFAGKAYCCGTHFRQAFIEPNEKPVLGPYMVSQFVETGTILKLTRNPYFWQVDTEGNQLPYIDELVFEQFQDSESMTLSMLNGEYDFTMNTNNADRPLYFQNRDRSELEIYLAQSDGSNTASIHFNMLHQDPVLREIFSNKDFRIAMSHAINRQEVIDILYAGVGEPRQLAPYPGSPYYNEQLETQYIEFDLDTANALLDELGLDQRDDEGYRLRPDGERLSFVITVSNEFGNPWGDLAELLSGYWREVGVEAIVDLVDPDIRNQRRDANQLDVTIFTSEGGAGITAILDARYYLPVSVWSLYALPWSAWYSPWDDAVNEWAEEPPQEVQDMYGTLEAALQAPTVAERNALMGEIMQFAADQFWAMGISSSGTVFFPIHKDIGNVPETWYDGWIPGGIAIAYPQQWYWTSQ